MSSDPCIYQPREFALPSHERLVEIVRDELNTLAVLINAGCLRPILPEQLPAPLPEIIENPENIELISGLDCCGIIVRRCSEEGEPWEPPPIPPEFLVREVFEARQGPLPGPITGGSTRNEYLWTAPAWVNEINLLLVGGGGGCQPGATAGGGGGGAVRTFLGLPVTPGATYELFIADTRVGTERLRGRSSWFRRQGFPESTLLALGGGASVDAATLASGECVGSSGGGGRGINADVIPSRLPQTFGAPGTELNLGGSPPVIEILGTGGGDGRPSERAPPGEAGGNQWSAGGGGGGAGEPALTDWFLGMHVDGWAGYPSRPCAVGGNGNPGKYVGDIFGDDIGEAGWFGGGGIGGSRAPSTTPPTGGQGGGGTWPQSDNTVIPLNGTGGGGAGAPSGYTTNQTGRSGLVVIQYASEDYVQPTPPEPTPAVAWDCFEIEGVAGRIVVTDGAAQAGNPVIDLAPVALNFGGTPQALSVDGFGRVFQVRPFVANDFAALIPSTTGGVLPVVTGEVPPVLVYLDDGSLVYSGVA